MQRLWRGASCNAVCPQEVDNTMLRNNCSIGRGAPVGTRHAHGVNLHALWGAAVCHALHALCGAACHALHAPCCAACHAAYNQHASSLQAVFTVTHAMHPLTLTQLHLVYALPLGQEANGLVQGISPMGSHFVGLATEGAALCAARVALEQVWALCLTFACPAKMPCYNSECKGNSRGPCKDQGVSKCCGRVETTTDPAHCPPNPGKL